MKPNRPLIVILSTVALDAVGIGLIMPVLPGLLRDLVHSNDVTAHYGILLALYALMQFACAPVLGALSDRFGRRPVLLVSLAGAAVDYAIMATAPFLWVLYIGRIVAGITGATGAVAGAYIADITDGDERARHFGFMSACFGFGMVAGPVLGGLMGGFSPHAPFFAAAALNGLNFLTGCFLLPESHKGERRPLRREALNPLASFRWARGMTVVAALMAVFFIMQLVGQVPAALWVIFGEDRFHWDATTIGISLARIWHSAFTRPGNDHRPCSRPARRKAGTHARNDCRRHRLHPACLRDTGMDGVPDHGPACFGWHRNAGAASNVVQAGG